MRIAVDAMGGDFAPLAPVKGALDAHERFGTEITLVGRREAVEEALRACGRSKLPSGVTLVEASEVIEICDPPARAFSQKPDSSMTVGLKLVKEGKADGFVSAGSTGALLAGATFVVKRIQGLRRVALAPVIPTATGRAVLIDCGANAECTVEFLLQFAYLGSYYASKMLGIEKPHVGLLNIGAEESKGDALRIETYQKLRQAHERGDLNFTGNVEAKEALLGQCDVIVSDGFSGNILLKTVEGAGKMMGGMLKDMLMKNAGTKVAALLLRGGLNDFKRTLDPNEVGGTALLGITRPVIKAHGSSNEVAFRNAIRQAVEVAKSDIAADIARDIDKMRVTREKKLSSDSQIGT